LVVRGCVDEAGPARALVLGGGLRSTAVVEGRRLGGAWRPCDYLRVTGTYDCAGLVTAYDGTATLLNDAPPSWGFVTPAILASAYTTDVEIRITLHARLAGRYDAAVSEGSVTFTAGSDGSHKLERQVVDYPDRGDRRIEIRAGVPMTSWAFTFVRDDAIVPDRPFLAAPPAEPPVEIRALAAQRR
ncbi:MAG TPA: hypothetical protein VIX73_03240, partial [Kofleriaceae bacterium]